MNFAVRAFALIMTGTLLVSIGNSDYSNANVRKSEPNCPQVCVDGLSAGSVFANIDSNVVDDDHYGILGKFSAGATSAAILNTARPIQDNLSNNELDSSTTDTNILTASVTEDESTPKETFFGYTNLGISRVDKLNVRESGNRSSNTIGQMDEGAACEIISVEDNWAKIESGEVKGYVMASYLATGDEAKDIANRLATEMVTVHADALRVRSDATKNSSVIAKVNNGTELLKPNNDENSDSEEWVSVKLENNTTGYVASEYVDIAKKLMTARTITQIRKVQESTQNVISSGTSNLSAFATQFVGNRYKWGGTSLTSGADCSGFVMSVYAKYGVSLPHSSASQANYGRTVSASEAQPGDLFFYGRGGKRIGHVAIYIGNGQIVHAANSRDGIVISSAYYQTPVTVKRVLN